MMSHISDRAAQADSSPSASGRGLARTLKVGLDTASTPVMAQLHKAQPAQAGWSHNGSWVHPKILTGLRPLWLPITLLAASR